MSTVITPHVRSFIANRGATSCQKTTKGKCPLEKPDKSGHGIAAWIRSEGRRRRRLRPRPLADLIGSRYSLARVARRAFLFVFLCVCGFTSLFATNAQLRADGPVAAQHGLVVSVSAPGSDVGRDILKKGGNAVDAAVATAFALAVTYPQAGNIGGGGFMVVYPGGAVEPVVFEYRETAPAAATKTMFRRDDSHYGCKVVGVPGTVRGLGLAHQRFGKLPWKDVVAPAVALARDGFALDAAVASSLNGFVATSKEFPEVQRAFGKNGRSRLPSGTEAAGPARQAGPTDGDWREGDRLVQPDLAKTLQAIADEGPNAFYTGRIADQIADEMKRGNGLITKADLAGYEAHARQPVHGTYRGYDVYGPPPPSSGGTALVEMLNILENFDLAKHDRFSPETMHLMIESMRRAYCDRARYLGDSDFVKIPPYLTTKEYGHRLAKGIDLNHATPSAELAKDVTITTEGDNTTHFSVIDSSGMAVANTYTLEHSYGSRVVVKGAGFLLNNEMMDFNWQPGVTGRDGTIGTEANQIAPGKRMLSSMTPTIVAKDCKVVLVTGSPGSRTIINTVLNVVVNVLDYHMDVQAAVDAPRLHHQWFPDEARFEGKSRYPATVAKLQALGHIVTGIRQGDAHSIWVDPKTGTYYGAADRRISGKAAGY
jgi:gamma-glutamyltranspeptidase/glutathione hydrolase